MKKPVITTAVTIIVNACIWGFVMIMSSVRLSGTGAYQEIQNILAAGSSASLIIVAGGLLGLMKMLKPNQ